MKIETLSTEGLGDRSYIVSADGIAVVIDPQRDIDRILDHLAAEDLQLALVCETHIHNDYVTGGLALARLTRVDYAVSAHDAVTFHRRGVDDDTVIDLGGLTVRPIHTPGHTPNHLSYLITAGDNAGGVFTGGSMLYATVGRTDLIGPDQTEGLTRDQYRSVRRLADTLPAETTVHPTHGFGSFCASAGGGDRSEGTIADERAENIACTTPDEDEFVERLTSGFTAHPPYYSHMGPLNLAGPLAPDLSQPAAAEPAALAARIARGEWVVDVRDRVAFADRHLAGSISADGSGALATYLGWAIPWGLPLSLVGDTADQIAAAQRELVRIGLDRPMAIAVGGPDTYATGQSTASYAHRPFSALSGQDDAVVVDVRRLDEWEEGHLTGSVHLPLEDVADGADDLPDAELWVHCASGYRASIAASIIAKAGHQIVLIDDDWENAADAGRKIIT